MQTNNFTLPAIFASHMILQRNKPIHIWGTGESGLIITLKFDKDVYSTQIIDSKWSFTLPPTNSSKSFDMVFQCNDQVIKISDVVFGEVYLAGGQSNMQYQLKDSIGGYKEILNSKKHDIRYYHTPRLAHEDAELPEDELSGWYSCDEENSPFFSAVAYFFAEKIEEYIDCPIGIIGCNWGATSVTAWLPKEELIKIPKTKDYYFEKQAEFNNENDKKYRAREEAYANEIMLWKKR